MSPPEHTGSVVIPARGPPWRWTPPGSREDGLQAEAPGRPPRPLPSGWLLLGAGRHRPLHRWSFPVTRLTRPSARMGTQSCLSHPVAMPTSQPLIASTGDPQPLLCEWFLTPGPGRKWVSQGPRVRWQMPPCVWVGGHWKHTPTLSPHQCVVRARRPLSCIHADPHAPCPDTEKVSQAWCRACREVGGEPDAVLSGKARSLHAFPRLTLSAQEQPHRSSHPGTEKGAG